MSTSGNSVNKNNKNGKRKMSGKCISKTLLFEIAWEVCNQVGGIHTVLQSKSSEVTSKWKDNYCLIGPYCRENTSGMFEEVDTLDGPIGIAIKKMREMGFDVRYGYWLISGRPKVILLNHRDKLSEIDSVKHKFWADHGIPAKINDHLVDEVLSFANLVEIFFDIISDKKIKKKKSIVAHFHEWMSGAAIPAMKKKKINVGTVFTTHATLLGRYLAMNDDNFYSNIKNYNWEQEAKNFDIEAGVKIERAAAHGCDVLTTVSDVTSVECKHLLGRDPDVILPNGLNIKRFEAVHKFQNLHLDFKEKIHNFTMAHFFQSYTFDLDKTLYLFTSGRFEYENKGYDLTLEALSRLNWKLKKDKSDMTVVMFFITKRPYHSINPEVLQSRAMMSEIKTTCEHIKKQVGERLFVDAAVNSDNKFPSLNKYVDDYWRLRLRRTVQSWKSDKLPTIVTHNLVDDTHDPILNFLRTSNMVNNEDDNVKVVYHPEFISPASPLFGMDYEHFVRGCHLGIFPSLYEPWGYTPLECMAMGIPSITSDLSGFGSYVSEKFPKVKSKGIYVIKRKEKSFDEAADELAEKMYSFTKLPRRERIKQRNKVEQTSIYFDWKYLMANYDKAYQAIFEKMKLT